MAYIRPVLSARALLLVILSAFVLAGPVEAVAEVDKASWNLGTVYPDRESWEAERLKIYQDIQALEKFQTAPPSKKADLLTALELVGDARSRAGKMARVGLLEWVVATDSESALARREEGDALEARVEESAAFLAPAVRNIGEKKVRQWMQNDDRFDHHQRRLNRIFRLAPFAPAPGSEKVTQNIVRQSRAANDAFEALVSTDLNWPVLAENGETASPQNLSSLRRNSNHAVRRSAYKTLFSHLHSYEDIFGVLLTRRIEGDLLWAKAHGLNSSIDGLLTLQDGYEPGRYDVMFSKAKAAAPSINRAAAALAEAFDLDSVQFDDLFLIPSVSSREFSREKAREFALQSAEKFGPDYRDLMAARLEMPWMHLDDIPNKTRGGGVFWQVGGGNPYTYFTYRDDYQSARTYSGAAFLMMGYASVPENQPPDRREEDFAVFGNALWYYGQNVFHDVLKSEKLDRQTEIQIAAAVLLRNIMSFVNNVAVAELEHLISKEIDQGNFLTGAQISEMYIGLLNEYFGGDVINIPPHSARIWMGYPTLFYGAHHIAWAEASAVALALQQGVRESDSASIEVVRDGIRQSSTHLSADIMQADENGDLYDDALKQIEQMTQQLEALQDQ